MSRSEDWLDHARAERRAFVDSAQDAIITTDPSFVVVEWNRAAERMYGWSAAEAIGVSMANLIPTRYTTRSRAEVLREYMQSGSWRGDVIQTTRDGRELAVHASVTMIRDEAGEPRGVLAINRDMTEQVAAQQRLIAEREQLLQRAQRSQHLEAIGRLAGGIAHDINNLMTVISVCTELISSRLGADSPSQEELGEIQAAGLRAQQLVTQLLAFSRTQVLTPRTVDLNVRITSLVGMLRRIIGADMQLDLKLQEGLWPVSADPSRMEQVLVNLAVNAREAMPGGGTLSIKTTNTTVDSALARLHPGMDPGDYIEVRVRDDGMGMSEAVRARIFEPFFTTQETGRGTGLGLAMVYGILTQSGGFIDVESAPGQGTQFRFFLPRVMPPSQPEEPSPARAGEHLLVVEDEAVVRRLLKRVLTSAGYTVTVAVDGVEALEIYARERGSIDLVLTDMVMPRMGGRELAASLTSRGMNRVVFMSGYTSEADHLNSIGAWFIPKPFGIDPLLETIRGALEDERLA